MPNYQYADPWRLWFNQWDLISLTTLESPHGTVIPNASVFLRPLNRQPGHPYTHLELDRSTIAAFGAGPTPQASIWVTGTWGFTADTEAAGTLAAAMGDTTSGQATVSNGALLGVGDLMIADSERMLIQERAAISASLTLSGTGCTTGLSNDQSLTTAGGGSLNLGEVILIDAERMLIEDITAGVALVRRGWDGTTLAAHTAGVTVYAYRLLTVLRGQLGSAAATHLISAPVSRHLVPSLIRDLAIAEAVNRVLQETAGYARMVGEGDAARPAPGFALADLWDETTTAYGRKARSRAV